MMLAGQTFAHDVVRLKVDALAQEAQRREQAAGYVAERRRCLQRAQKLKDREKAQLAADKCPLLPFSPVFDDVILTSAIGKAPAAAACRHRQTVRLATERTVDTLEEQVLFLRYAEHLHRQEARAIHTRVQCVSAALEAADVDVMAAAVERCPRLMGLHLALPTPKALTRLRVEIADVDDGTAGRLKRQVLPCFKQAVAYGLRPGRFAMTLQRSSTKLTVVDDGRADGLQTCIGKRLLALRWPTSVWEGLPRRMSVSFDAYVELSP